MIRKISNWLFVIGIVLISANIFLYLNQSNSTSGALGDAEALLGGSDNSYEEEAQDETLQRHDDSATHTEDEFEENKPPHMINEEPPSMTKEEFEPQVNEVIGLLHIPKLDESLPIIGGVDDEQLDRGVGHLPSTVLPMDGDQILLSGHRDTVFTNFDELEKGDNFIVELPYGKFEYEMKETEIVDKDDTSVIRSMDEEVLTLSTCYPFSYLGNAPERYVIYAYPVEQE